MDNRGNDNVKSEKKPDLRFIAVLVLCIVATAAFITSVVLSSIAISKYKGKDPYLPPSNIGAYEKLADAYKYNAVEVRCGNTFGSAFVYTLDGEDMYLFTNHHVVRGDHNAVELRFYGKSNHNPKSDVEVVGYDDVYDIALLKAKNYPQNDYVDLKKDGLICKTAKMGAEILCLGNNLGHGIQAQNGIVSNGSLVRSIQDDDAKQRIRAVVGVCAPLNSGDSGAAVFDLNGRLIGMNTWKVTRNSAGENVDDTSYLTPAPIIEAAFENLVTKKQTGEIDFPVILWQSYGGSGTVTNCGNLYIHDMKVALAFEDTKLTVVSADALARELRAGDVITRFGDTQVTANNFPSVIGELFNYNYNGVGKKLTLQVERGGSSIAVEIENLKSVR